MRGNSARMAEEMVHRVWLVPPVVQNGLWRQASSHKTPLTSEGKELDQLHQASLTLNQAASFIAVGWPSPASSLMAAVMSEGGSSARCQNVCTGRICNFPVAFDNTESGKTNQMLLIRRRFHLPLKH